jgi:hypothetical protein
LTFWSAACSEQGTIWPVLDGDASLDTNATDGK